MTSLIRPIDRLGLGLAGITLRDVGLRQSLIGAHKQLESFRCKPKAGELVWMDEARQEKVLFFHRAN